MKRILIASACLFSCAPTAFAADTLETVVVTASRAPVDREQTGSAVSVITGETLQDRQIDQVFDALREVPGVEVSRTGSVGSLSQVRIRGAEAGHTLVLIDGVRVNDPAQSSEEFNFANLMTGGIARVEVLRGPQSALWGADALSGVVNVITVQPVEGFEASAGAEYGSFDTKELYGRISGGTADFGALLQAQWLDTGGINIARTGHENDGYRNTSVGGKAFANLSPQFTVSLSLNRVDARTDSEATDFFGTFSIPLDAGDRNEFEATYGRAEARWTSGGGIRVVAGASLVRTEGENFTSAFGLPFNVSFNDRLKGGDTAFDLAAHIPWEGWGAQQRVSLLAETRRETFEMMRLDLPSANQNQNERRSGIAGEYWIGWEDVAMSLGARHDWNERFDDSTTWRATVSARVAEPLRAHASVGTGVKNPDFFEMFGFFPAPAFEGNPNLKPEKSLGWDAGLEWRQGPFLLDVTYFHADLEDEIFTDFSVSPNTARNASGESERRGIEVTARVELTEGLTLDGAYTYLDATESDDAAEIRRPHHIASLNLDWKFAGDRALLNAGVAYHGSQRDTAFLNAPPFSMPVTLGSYTLVRVAGSYDITDRVALFARVENALDEQYEEVFGYRTRGLGIFGGIRASFN